MSDPDESTRGEQALEREIHKDEAQREDGTVYFLPQLPLTDREVRVALRSGSQAQRAQILSGLLCYGLWDDIWSYTDREQIRGHFDHLQLPDGLRRAWGRTLGITPDPAAD